MAKMRTNQYIYEALGGPSGLTPQQVADTLQAHEERFEKLLDFYKPPSSASRTSVRSGSVNGRTLPKPVQEFVLLLSQSMGLDELQAFDVLQQYLREQQVEQFPDEQDVDAITQFYYEERLYLLEATACLLLDSKCEDTASAALMQLVAKLVREGLLCTVLKQYSASCSEKVPSNLGRQAATVLATRLVREQLGLLKILFCLFWAEPGSCTPAELVRVAQLFGKQEFGKQVNQTLLHEDGRNLCASISRMSILVLLVGLKLEEAFESTAREVGRKHPLSRSCVKEFLELDKLLLDLAAAFPQHMAPVSLAWSCLAFRAKDLASDSPVEFAPHANAALQADVFGNLAAMTRSPVFEDDSLNVTVYKTVLRSLFTAMLSTFSADQIIAGIPSIDPLVDAYSCVFNDEVDLSERFIQVDYKDPAKASLLHATMANFPAVVAPTVKILTALANDAASARWAFSLLENMPSFTAQMSPANMGFVSDRSGGQQLVVEQPFMLDGLLLPRNTVGTVLAKRGRHVTVRWRVRFSGWAYFIFMLRSFTERMLQGKAVKAQRALSVGAVLEFLHTLTACDSSLAIAVQEHNPRFSLIQIFFQILVSCALQEMHALGGSGDLVVHTINCIEAFAHTYPQEAWTELRNSGIIEGLGSGGQVSHSTAGYIKHLLYSFERPSGRFCITLPFLDLISTLLAYLQRWPVPLNAPAHANRANEFGACLAYVRTHILTSYHGWRYARVSERWQIGIKVMNLLFQVLTDVSCPGLAGQKTPPLKESLLNTLLFDSSFHQVLFSIIGIGYRALEQLYAKHRVSEARTLEELVVGGLRVLEQVLLHSEASRAGRSSSSLEHALMNFTIGKENANLVYIIASYIAYRYDPKIPLLSTRVLTLLCKVSIESSKPRDGSEQGRRPPSLVAYFGSRASAICLQFLAILRRGQSTMPSGGAHEAVATNLYRLRIAILHLISTALRYQPGLSELFISPDESPGTAAALVQQKGKEAEAKQGVVHVVSNLLMRDNAKQRMELLLAKGARLLAEALGTVHSLWRFAPDHKVVLTEMRERAAFWDCLFLALAPSTAAGDSHGMDTGDEQEHVQKTCYRRLARSWVLRIAALELHYTPVNGKLGDAFGKSLGSLCTETALRRWCSEYLVCSVGTHQKRLKQHAEAVGVPLEVLLVRGDRTFGTHFQYDLRQARKKLLGSQETALLSAHGQERHRQEATALLDTLELANLDASKYEVGLLLCQALSNFVQLSNLRQPHLLVSMEAGKAQFALSLLQDIATVLASASTGTLSMRGPIQAQSELVMHFIHQFCKHNPILPREFPLDALLESICTAMECIVVFSVEENTAILLSQLTAILVLFNHVPPGEEPEKLSAVVPLVAACLEAPDLVGTCYAILGKMTVMAQDRAALIAHLDKYSILSTVLRRFAEDVQQKRNLPRVQAAVQLLQCMTGQPQTAETLHARGLLSMLCNSNFPLFDLCCERYEESGERNPWNAIWVTVLRCVANMLLVLAQDERVREQVFQFAVVHDRQLLSSWSLQRQATAITLAELEEASAATSLCCLLVRYLGQWRFVAPQQLAAVHGSCLILFQQYVLWFLKPVDLVQLAQSKSSKERESQLSSTTLESHEGASRPTTPRSKDEDSIPSASKLETSQFYIDIVDAMHVILSNILTIIRTVCARDDTGEEVEPVFTHILETSTVVQPVASMGSLLFCLSACMEQLRRKALRPNTGCQQALLLYSIEHAVAILVAHVRMYAHARHASAVELKDFVNATGAEVEGFLVQLEASLQRMRTNAAAVTPLPEGAGTASLQFVKQAQRSVAACLEPVRGKRK